MTASIVLALLSAFFFAAAGALQHTATRAIALRSASSVGWLPVLGLLSRMLRNGVWLCGLTCNVMGFVVHAAALHLGSISVVQALLSVQLLFALPLATARTKTMPLARDWLGTVAVGAGITTLVLSRGSVPQTLDRISLVPPVAVAGLATMAGLVGVAKASSGNARTALVGTASGIGFSLTAVLTIVVADRLMNGGAWAVFTDWHVYALALSGLIAAILVQDAFASGSLPAAMTAMIVADPIASWLWSAILFDQVPPTTPAALASLVISGALISAGVALLAYSPTIRLGATPREAALSYRYRRMPPDDSATSAGGGGCKFSGVPNP